MSLKEEAQQLLAQMREMDQQKAQAKAAGRLDAQDWKAWERTKATMRRDARALDAKSQALLESAQAEVLRTAQVGTVVLRRHSVSHLAEQQECGLSSRFDEQVQIWKRCEGPGCQPSFIQAPC